MFQSLSFQVLLEQADVILISQKSKVLDEQIVIDITIFQINPQGRKARTIPKHIFFVFDIHHK